MQARMELSIKLPVRVVRKEKWFLACCDVLDVFAQGDSEEQAKKNLSESLYLFFRSCLERGTLDAVLKQSGFAPIDSGEIADMDNISIPLHLLAQFREQTCHA